MTHEKAIERLVSIKSYIDDDHFKEENIAALNHAICSLDRIKRIARELEENVEIGYFPTPQRCKDLARILMLETGID